MFHQQPSGLPPADRFDADGRPLWWPATIDAWCSKTGRQVAEDSLWIFRADPVSSVEMQRGLVRLGAGRREFYAIVWDTELGHAIYLQSLEDTGDHRDWLAPYAAELIEPRWWSSAVVIMPQTESFGWAADEASAPLAEIYSLRPHHETEEGLSSPLSERLRRFLGRITATELASAELPSTERVRAVWESQLPAHEIASVLGVRLPIWIDNTATPGNAQQTLSYNHTFTIADTVTEWPATQARLEQAIRIGMPQDFPAGFAALACDAATVLDDVRLRHARLADSGPGWYLVCRPAKPAPPVELEPHLTGVDLVDDADLVAAELTELRAIAGDLDIDDERGDPYDAAATLLSWQLRRAAVVDGAITGLHDEYVPVADDDHLIQCAPWTGPVVDAWQRNLTELTGAERASALRTRRARALLDHNHNDHDSVQHIYRDQHGRYVLVIRMPSGEDWSVAEWPKSLATVQTWTDKTVLAADDTGGAVTLLALTPTDDGHMRTDPVPVPVNSHRDAFSYGYGGGTPGYTYAAILRCALGDKQSRGIARAADTSQLWQAISTTTGPLRLSWPQVQLWAKAERRADHNAGQRH